MNVSTVERCLLLVGSALASASAAAAGAGLLEGTLEVSALSQAAPGPCSQKSIRAAVDVTLQPDGTFEADLPFLPPAQALVAIPVEGTAVVSRKATLLTLDAASLDAIAATIGLDGCKIENGANVTGVAVNVKRASLVLNKRQMGAKLQVSATIVTSYQRPNDPHDKGHVTVTYSLSASGTWAPAP